MINRTNIRFTQLAGVVAGKLPSNTIVGNAKDAHGTFFVAFVATDKETGRILATEKGSIKLNWRKSLRQGDAQTKTPGEVLPAAPKSVVKAEAADGSEVEVSEDLLAFLSL